MAVHAVADTGFLVALLRDRDTNHTWAVELAARHPPPWHTCEAVLSEAFFVLHRVGGEDALASLIRREALIVSFAIQSQFENVLRLMEKYRSVPMSFADACLVRMMETLDRAIVLSTDSDFRVYRMHGRQVIPSAMPPA